MQFRLPLVLVATRGRVHVCSAYVRAFGGGGIERIASQSLLLVTFACTLRITKWKSIYAANLAAKEMRFTLQTRAGIQIYFETERRFSQTQRFALVSFDVSLAERARDEIEFIFWRRRKIKMKRKAHFACHRSSYRLFQSTPDCPIR